MAVIDKFLGYEIFEGGGGFGLRKLRGEWAIHTKLDNCQLGDTPFSFSSTQPISAQQPSFISVAWTPPPPTTFKLNFDGSVQRIQPQQDSLSVTTLGISFKPHPSI
uniref:Fgenesh protein 42 n=1 Tax=Beta vulgaris TaxID=161934 RepID=Q20CD9_BETVU|nr:Fgenesh protein 42 [Beta vulgaris]